MSLKLFLNLNYKIRKDEKAVLWGFFIKVLVCIEICRKEDQKAKDEGLYEVNFFVLSFEVIRKRILEEKNQKTVAFEE